MLLGHQPQWLLHPSLSHTWAFGLELVNKISSRLTRFLPSPLKAHCTQKALMCNTASMPWLPISSRRILLKQVQSVLSSVIFTSKFPCTQYTGIASRFSPQPWVVLCHLGTEVPLFPQVVFPWRFNLGYTCEQTTYGPLSMSPKKACLNPLHLQTQTLHGKYPMQTVFFSLLLIFQKCSDLPALKHKHSLEEVANKSGTGLALKLGDFGHKHTLNTSLLNEYMNVNAT